MSQNVPNAIDLCFLQDPVSCCLVGYFMSFFIHVYLLLTWNQLWLKLLLWATGLCHTHLFCPTPHPDPHNIWKHQFTLHNTFLWTLQCMRYPFLGLRMLLDVSWLSFWWLSLWALVGSVVCVIQWYQVLWSVLDPLLDW